MYTLMCTKSRSRWKHRKCTPLRIHKISTRVGTLMRTDENYVYLNRLINVQIRDKQKRGALMYT